MIDALVTEKRKSKTVSKTHMCKGQEFSEASISGEVGGTALSNRLKFTGGMSAPNLGQRVEVPRPVPPQFT